jgi:radical SAM superfamily enzyme
LQSTDSKVLSVIDRKISIARFAQCIEDMKKYKVPFVVTLIYGLPFQNFNVCQETLKTLKELGVKDNQIKPFPLTLLPGSVLHSQKDEFNIQESSDLVPRVIGSNSFSKCEYREMEQLFTKFISTERSEANI